MPVANPAIVLVAAVALALVFGRVRPAANPVRALGLLARRMAGGASLAGQWANLAGAALVAFCALLSAIIARVVASGVPLFAMIPLGWWAASALKTALACLLLFWALSSGGGAARNDAFATRPALALSRETATLLLFTLFGLEAALAWTGALAAAEALPDPFTALARRCLALVHYVPARIAALAACLAAPFAGGRAGAAWAAVLEAGESGDPWHPEWVSAALEQARQRSGLHVAAAVLVVAAGCLAAMALPLAHK